MRCIEVILFKLYLAGVMGRGTGENGAVTGAGAGLGICLLCVELMGLKGRIVVCLACSGYI